MARREDEHPSYGPAIGALVAAAAAALTAAAPALVDGGGRALERMEASRTTETVRDLRECVERLSAIVDAPHHVVIAARDGQRSEAEVLAEGCRAKRLVKEGLEQTG